MSGTVDYTGSKKVTTTFPVAFSTTPTIATVEVYPSGDTKRSGRLGLSRTYESSSGSYNEIAYGAIEASSTGMSIRLTSNNIQDSLGATVYYVVVGK